MSKKSKAGRGALVRRLRRDFGITEEQARYAAESREPDMEAARYVDRARSRAGKLTTKQPAFDPWETHRQRCPVRPAGWCMPDEPRPPQPWGPTETDARTIGRGGALNRRGRTLGLIGLAAALGMS